MNLVTEASSLQLLSFLGDLDEGPQNPMNIGMNLEGIFDWSSAWIFKDAFKNHDPGHRSHAMSIPGRPSGDLRMRTLLHSISMRMAG
ncbi:MAG: hypothetical protein R3C11_17155 [Planctomycetaceae bacterium]